jgi:hypothetical protein
MGMSRRERRKLRHMAETIHDEDPLLAAMLGADTSSGPVGGAADDGGTRRPPTWSPWSPGAWAPGSGRYTPLGLF